MSKYQKQFQKEHKMCQMRKKVAHGVFHHFLSLTPINTFIQQLPKEISTYLCRNDASEGVDGIVKGLLISSHQHVLEIEADCLQNGIRFHDGSSEEGELHHASAHPNPLGTHARAHKPDGPAFLTFLKN